MDSINPSLLVGLSVFESATSGTVPSAMAQDWRTPGKDGIMSFEGVYYEQSESVNV
jgi:hypothetical protein